MAHTDDPVVDTADASGEATPAPRPASFVMLHGEGRVTVARRGSTMATCRLSGIIETVHVEWLIAELDRQVDAGVTAVFVDASRLPALSTSARRALGAWSLQHHAGLRALHVLGEPTVLDEPLDELGQALGDRLHRYHHAESYLAALQAYPS